MMVHPLHKWRFIAGKIPQKMGHGFHHQHPGFVKGAPTEVMELLERSRRAMLLPGRVGSWETIHCTQLYKSWSDRPWSLILICMAILTKKYQRYQSGDRIETMVNSLCLDVDQGSLDTLWRTEWD